MSNLTPINKIDFLSEVNDAVIFTKPYACIEVPQEYFDHKIAEYSGSTIILFGFFQINVYDEDPEDDPKIKPRKVFFKHTGVISTMPSSITERRDEETGEKIIVLHYRHGDKFIQSVLNRVDAKVATKMLDFMTLGYMPNVLDYEEVAKYWTDVSKHNGVSLDAMSLASIELIVSEIARDPKNYANTFRALLRSNPKTSHKSYKFINVKLIPRYTSVFASLTSGNARGNLISIISRKRQGEELDPSPVEQAIL